MIQTHWLYRLTVLPVTVAALAACSSNDGAGSSASAPINDPLVATYDGGLYVLDGKTLELKADIPLDGFLRVNPAGDDGHVLVTTDEGFRVLDAAGGRLTDDTFTAAKAGHVVPHGNRTVLFADGTGEITTFDPDALADGKPTTEKFTTPQPHHGVAVILNDGTMLHSIGDPESRSGAVALRGGAEIARSEDCPGIHGETIAADETVVFGCENGALEFANGAFTEVASPTPYGRIGTTKGHDASTVVLGDMKVDADAEVERPEQFSLVDTATNQMKVVALPPSVSYSFRSLARGPGAEALVLGTDGKLRVVDPATGATVKTVDVTAPWTEPDDWQEPRPTVFTREDAVYVTDPATKQIHVVDLQVGTITKSATLPQEPNELSGAIGHQHG